MLNDYSINPPDLRQLQWKTLSARLKEHARLHCALHGHAFRSDVPGIQGSICTMCGGMEVVIEAEFPKLDLSFVPEKLRGAVYFLLTKED